MASVEMDLIGDERVGTMGQTAWLVAGLRVEDIQFVAPFYIYSNRLTQILQDWK